jgi:twitching motility protein PilI
MSQSTSAFQTLVLLAQQARAAAQGLPAQADIRPEWSGIGFSLMGCRFVAPIGEISEMLEVPPFTHLPGVQPWVKGVANVRGRLLPIFDLAQFFGERITSPRKKRRILILETETLYTGLMVDEVHGMQHFPMDEYRDHPGQIPDVIQPFVSGCYPTHEHTWSLFRPAFLADDLRFTSAAKA